MSIFYENMGLRNYGKYRDLLIVQMLLICVKRFFKRFARTWILPWLQEKGFSYQNDHINYSNN